MVSNPTLAEQTERSKAPSALLSSPVAGRVALILAVLFLIASAIPNLSLPPGRDQGTYLTVGQALLDGKVLYREIWDNKPPGIFLAYAGIARVFGRVLWSIGAMDILLLFATSFLLYRFVRRYLGVIGASIALVVNASVHEHLPHFWLVQPETFQVLCGLGAFLLLRERKGRWQGRYLLAGALIGVGFLFKYTFAAVLPLFLVLAWQKLEKLEGDSPRFALALPLRECAMRAVVCLAGFGAVVVLFLAVLVMQGAWPAFQQSQFVVLPRYAAMAMQYEHNYLFRSVAMTAVGMWEPNLWVLLATLIAAWRSRDLARYVPMAAVAMALVVPAVLQMRFHTYYFQVCYPFFAALWAYLVVWILENAQKVSANFRQKGRRVAAVLVWVLVANVLFWPVPTEAEGLLWRYGELETWKHNPEVFYANYSGAQWIDFLGGQMEVLKFLRQNAGPQDKVFLWGSNSLIYFASGHPPPTRFALNLGLIARWAQPEWLPEVAGDVKRASPKYIIVTRGDQIPQITYSDLDSEKFLEGFPELGLYIQQNYISVKHLKNFEIYQHR